MSKPNISYIKPVNDTISLINNFLEGDYFDVKLSEKILNTFSTTNTISYKEVIEYVKKHLNSCKKYSIYRDVFLIKNDTPLQGYELAAMIRYFNICHNDNFILVYNDDIVHIPKKYKDYDKEDIKLYVEQMFKMRLYSFTSKQKINMVVKPMNTIDHIVSIGEPKLSYLH